MPHLFFSGCARDCAHTIQKNIDSIYNLERLMPGARISIYIFENDSTDDTLGVLSSLSELYPTLTIVSQPGLVHIIPHRETRLAYCRDVLLKRIIASSQDGLYIPFDPDLDLRLALDPKTFLLACNQVTCQQYQGIFPITKPFYYDIHALRADSWCPDSAWKRISDSNPQSKLDRIILRTKHIISRQVPSSHLSHNALIPVHSAFGGIGIYSISAISEKGASYRSDPAFTLEPELCEHVVFNSYFDSLFLFTKWQTKAPKEHLVYLLLYPYHYLPFLVALIRFCRSVSDALKSI